MTARQIKAFQHNVRQRVRRELAATDPAALRRLDGERWWRVLWTSVCLLLISPGMLTLAAGPAFLGWFLIAACSSNGQAEVEPWQLVQELLALEMHPHRCLTCLSCLFVAPVILVAAAAGMDELQKNRHLTRMAHLPISDRQLIWRFQGAPQMFMALAGLWAVIPIYACLAYVHGFALLQSVAAAMGMTAATVACCVVVWSVIARGAPSRPKLAAAVGWLATVFTMFAMMCHVDSPVWMALLPTGWANALVHYQLIEGQSWGWLFLAPLAVLLAAAAAILLRPPRLGDFHVGPAGTAPASWDGVKRTPATAGETEDSAGERFRRAMAIDASPRSWIERFVLGRLSQRQWSVAQLLGGRRLGWSRAWLLSWPLLLLTTLPFIPLFRLLRAAQMPVPPDLPGLHVIPWAGAALAGAFWLARGGCEPCGWQKSNMPVSASEALAVRAKIGVLLAVCWLPQTALTALIVRQVGQLPWINCLWAGLLPWLLYLCLLTPWTFLQFPYQGPTAKGGRAGVLLMLVHCVLVSGCLLLPTLLLGMTSRMGASAALLWGLVLLSWLSWRLHDQLARRGWVDWKCGPMGPRR